MGKRKLKGAFVKIQKNKAYYKRFQVKPRRRREGKTNYHRRRRLIIQAKNKYTTPKHRLVVRCTNKQIICQVTVATLLGDHVISAASSLELKRYGLAVGLTNYPAAYCTGLLLGHRLLQKLKFEKKEEEAEVTGEVHTTSIGKKKYYLPENLVGEERRPLRVFLDVGLARTSLGAKIFGAMKGVSDAGIDVPHGTERFPGWDKESKAYDAAEHREVILGGRVADYMRDIKQEDEESGTSKLSEQFGSYVKENIDPDALEELYLSVHAKIREDPSPKFEKTKKERQESGESDKWKFDGKFKRKAKDTLEERKQRVEEKRKKIKELEGDEEGTEIDMNEDDDEGSEE